jgi:hypothetical protein
MNVKVDGLSHINVIEVSVSQKLNAWHLNTSLKFPGTTSI